MRPVQMCTVRVVRWMVRPASRIARRRGPRTCRAEAVAYSDGEHCSTFRCEEQRNKLRSPSRCEAYVRSSRSAEQAGRTIHPVIALWRNPELLAIGRSEFYSSDSVRGGWSGWNGCAVRYYDMAVWPYSRLDGAKRAGIAMLHRRIRDAGRKPQKFIM